jgi:hypothetical protein
MPVKEGFQDFISPPPLIRCSTKFAILLLCAQASRKKPISGAQIISATMCRVLTGKDREIDLPGLCAHSVNSAQATTTTPATDEAVRLQRQPNAMESREHCRKKKWPNRGRP